MKFFDNIGYGDTKLQILVYFSEFTLDEYSTWICPVKGDIFRNQLFFAHPRLASGDNTTNFTAIALV